MIRSLLVILRSLFLPAIFVLVALEAASQAKLILNGGILTISNGGALVIETPDPAAISRNAGYINSEGPNNRIVWFVGAGNGHHFTVPFGNLSHYLPLAFTASAGVGANAKFVLSTYPTASWNNNNSLPPGVTNANEGGADNSGSMIDRFWQLAPVGYTQRPTVQNLSFTYLKSELAAPNTIVETNLVARRWNSDLQLWDDYLPQSAVDTSSKTLTVTSVASQQLFNWWTLTSLSAALPVTLTNLMARAQDGDVMIHWETLSEQRTDHFEIWRSENGIDFTYLGTVRAAGNSTQTLSYSFGDKHPASGTAHYRLKIVDTDGKYTWSVVVGVYIQPVAAITVFPNPASSFIVIRSPFAMLNNRPIAMLVDAYGRQLTTILLLSTSERIDISHFASGAYAVVVHFGSQTQIIRFIKTTIK